jgi:hypothetical protein
MSRRLLTAGIVAAVAFGPAAHAAVVVTALSDPLFLRDEFFGSYHPVDVDGNGSTDFTFGYNPGFVGLRTEAANRVIFSPDPPPNLGGPVASLSHGFRVQSTLESSTFSWRSSDLLGGFVSPGENAFASIVHALSTGSSTDFNGRGYIGVEFESTLGTHYGYLDIEAGPGFDGITFYGWAYETQPGAPIFAGQVPEPSVLVLAEIAAVSFLLRRRRK